MLDWSFGMALLSKNHGTFMIKHLKHSNNIKILRKTLNF
jgi:hypothetical protein